MRESRLARAWLAQLEEEAGEASSVSSGPSKPSYSRLLAAAEFRVSVGGVGLSRPGLVGNCSVF